MNKFLYQVLKRAKLDTNYLFYNIKTDSIYKFAYRQEYLHLDMCLYRHARKLEHELNTLLVLRWLIGYSTEGACSMHFCHTEAKSEDPDWGIKSILVKGCIGLHRLPKVNGWSRPWN
jgi:hypothetical protein